VDAVVLEVGVGGHGKIGWVEGSRIAWVALWVFGELLLVFFSQVKFVISRFLHNTFQFPSPLLRHFSTIIIYFYVSFISDVSSSIAMVLFLLNAFSTAETK
jgi:hypothetical protein